MGSFYCQNANGQEDFSIDDWNKSYEEVHLMNLTEKEENEILFPSPCDKQCFDCISIVGKRRLQTKNLLQND